MAHNYNIAYRTWVGLLWLLPLSYIRFGFNILSIAILARLITPHTFGQYAILLVGVELLFLLFTPVSTTVICNNRALSGVFRTALRLTYTWGATLLAVVLVTITVCTFIGWISWHVGAVINCLIVIHFMTLVGTIYATWLEKDIHFRFIAVIFVVASALAALCAIIVAWLEWGIWSLVFRDFVMAFIVCVCTWYYVSRRWQEQPAREGNYLPTVRALFQYGWRYFQHRLSEIVSYRYIVFVLSGVANLHTVGLYERASYIAQLPHNLFGAIVGRVFFPAYSQMRDDTQKMSRYFSWHLYLMVRCCLIIALLVWLFPSQIITLLLGEQWRDASPYLTALTLWIALRAVWYSMSMCLHAIGLAHKTARTYWMAIGVMSLAGGVLWLTNSHAWSTLAWAMGVSVIGECIYMGYYLWRHNIGIDYVQSCVLPILLSIVILALNQWLVTEMHWLWQVILFCGLWCGVLFVLEINKWQQLWWVIRHKV